MLVRFCKDWPRPCGATQARAGRPGQYRSHNLPVAPNGDGRPGSAIRGPNRLAPMGTPAGRRSISLRCRGAGSGRVRSRAPLRCGSRHCRGSRAWGPGGCRAVQWRIACPGQTSRRRNGCRHEPSRWRAGRRRSSGYREVEVVTQTSSFCCPPTMPTGGLPNVVRGCKMDMVNSKYADGSVMHAGFR